MLLDEPSAGLNRQEKEDLARYLLRARHEFAPTLVWIEQRDGAALWPGTGRRRTARRAVGRGVIEAYLGVDRTIVMARL